MSYKLSGNTGTFILNGVPYPWNQYRVRINNSQVSIFPISGTMDYVLNNVPLANVIDRDGNMFESPESFNEYWNEIGNVNVHDQFLRKGAVDANGRLRTSELNTQIEIKQFVDDEGQFVDRENGGAATQIFDQSRGGVIMAVTNNGDYAIAQSKQYATYFGGKSQLVEVSFDDMHPQTGVVKRVGYFTTNTVDPYDSNRDGIYLESTGSGLSIKIEKLGTVLLDIAQENWDYNPTWLDAENFNVFTFDFLYLGGTGVSFGFYKGREWYNVHTFNHASLRQGTFIGSPQKPIRYEIRSVGGAGTLTQVCAQVANEGTKGEFKTQSISTEDYQANTAFTAYVVAGYRLKSSHSDINAIISSFSVMAHSNDDMYWYLCKNPTFDGVKAFSDVSNSAIQRFDPDGNNNEITGGLIDNYGDILIGGCLQGNSANHIKFDGTKLGRLIDGTLDELYMVIKPIQGGLDVDVFLNINEYL